MVLERGMDVTKLMAEVQEWLHDKPEPMTKIAKELDVSYFWLQRFMKGQHKILRTDRLQMLVERMHSERAPKKTHRLENALNTRL